jgi:hypothetical protein
MIKTLGYSATKFIIKFYDTSPLVRTLSQMPNCLNARVFVPDKPFQPSLLFAGNARACPSENPLRYSTLW